MEDFIQQCRSKYFVKLGEQKFSPIMEASIGLSMDYSKQVSHNCFPAYPFFLSFPDKKYASLWLSISLLTNYYLDDYVNSNNTAKVHLVNGTLVDIYGSVLRFIREDLESGKLVFSSKDLPSGISFSKSILSVVKKTNRKALNTHKHFSRAKRDAKKNRNAISKILIPHEDGIINEQVLHSRIIFVTERGKMNSFRELMHDIEINNERLSHIFPENKNLILKPDLESFKNISNSAYEKECLDFIDNFNKLCEIAEYNEIQEELIFLKEILTKENSISKEFENKFLSFCGELNLNEFPKLKFVKERYPGFHEVIPTNVRAVVLNGVKSFFDYPDTVNAFLEKRVPVIIVSDRKIEKVIDVDKYNLIFSDNPNYLRINWNKEKIRILRKLSDSNTADFLDKELWNQCLRYGSQKIQIEITQGNKLDTLLPLLQKKITELEGYDVLKSAFYKKLYPALYALKNSCSNSDGTRQLINEFQTQYDALKGSGIDINLIETIERVLTEALEFDTNSKDIDLDTGTEIFASVLSDNGERILIPTEAKELSHPNQQRKSITFSGFPYKEFSGQYLLNSLFDFFIPDVKILCWPNEGSLTFHYIKRRLLGGYFTDNLIKEDCEIEGNILSIPNEYLLSSQEKIDLEIGECFNIKNPIDDDLSHQEEDIEKINGLRYSGFLGTGNQRSASDVKCNVLNFTDDTFMFLPLDGKILSEHEDDNEIQIKNQKFSELSVGMRIFKYKKSRAAYREISKKDKHIAAYFNELESWRGYLEKALEDNNRDIHTLESSLHKIQEQNNILGSNPESNNLKRWIYDDEIIAPNKSNLRLILLTQNIDDLENKLERLAKACRGVNGYMISLSSQIKKEIKRQIKNESIGNRNLQIEINGTLIAIESKTIAGLEKNDIPVDYANTRKILC